MSLKINWFFLGSVALNVLLFVLLFKGCSKTCVDSVVERVVHDTIRPKDELKPITVHVPLPKKAVRKDKPLPGRLPFHGVLSGDSAVDGYSTSPVFSSCDSIFYYSDSLYKPDDYRAVINDTLTDNRITGRSVWFANLKPEVKTTIEKTITLKDKPKFYVGAFTGLQIDYGSRKVTDWSIGPQMLLTVPQGAAVSYGFDAKNNGHLFSLLWKIKLKK